MKFSVNWLKEFVELPENVEKLAEILTLAGIEMGLELAGVPHQKGGVQAALAYLTDHAKLRHPAAAK